MRIATVVGATMALLMVGNCAQAGTCEIINGSFEDDGAISDLALKDPNGWVANLPADKFRGYVGSDWRTNGSYNLTLYSEFWKTFTEGEAATVTQQVDLTDVNEISFDLKLDTLAFTPWDPNLCTAVVLVDDEVVWESNSVGVDVRGEYFDQSFTVGEKYKTPGWHELSVGIRVNVTDILIDRYITHWDFVACTFYCGGGGLLAGDFNRDCYVNASDSKLLADAWADHVDLYDRRNLFHGDDIQGYGKINLFDFVAYANNWDGNLLDLVIFTEKWLGQVDLDDEHNLVPDDDVESSGIVNFFDFVIFADDWLASSYVEAPEE